jgi:hypothetical protein
METNKHYNIDNKEYYDFCNNCKKKINQIELILGVYGCEYCKKTNNITIHTAKKKRCKPCLN